MLEKGCIVILRLASGGGRFNLHLITNFMRCYLKICLIVLFAFPPVIASDLIFQSATKGEIGGIAISGDGLYVATMGHGGKLRVWEARSGLLLDESLSVYGNACTQIGFSPDSRYVYYSSKVGAAIRRWQDRKTIYFAYTNSFAFSIAVDVQRMKFYTVRDGELTIHSLDSGAEIAKLNLNQDKKHVIGDVSINDKGNLVMLSRKNGILIYDVDDKKVINLHKIDFPLRSLAKEDVISRLPKAEQQVVREQLTSVEGVATLAPDRDGRTIGISFYGINEKWFKMLNLSDQSFTEPIPYDSSVNLCSSLGLTGKYISFSQKTKNINILNPVNGEFQQLVATDIALKDTITGIDSCKLGRTIVVSTDNDWYCFEGNVEDLQSWKKRIYKSLPSTRAVADLCPATNRLIFGSQSGEVYALSFDRALTTQVCGSVGHEVLDAKAFRDGHVIVATAKSYFLLKNDKVLEIGQAYDPPYMQRIGSQQLLALAEKDQLPPLCAIFNSSGFATDQISMEQSTVSFHQSSPNLILTYETPGEDTRYEMFELGENGIGKFTQSSKIDSREGSEAISETKKTFLTTSLSGSLKRISWATGKATTIRDNVKVPPLGYLSPGGDYIVTIMNDVFGTPSTIVPLDAKFPLKKLKFSSDNTTYGAKLIGFTPRGNGFWLSLQSREACLFDSASGKHVATIRVHDNGAAIVDLPDGSYLCNDLAKDLVSRRIKGKADLLKPVSSSKVLEVLKPYVSKQ